MSIQSEKCSDCETADAKVTCGKCDECFCDGCDAKIHARGAFAKHTRFPFSGPKLSRFCSTHQDDILTFFCDDCFKPVCATCWVGVHRGHTFKPIKVAVDEIKTMIAGRIEPLAQEAKKIRAEIQKQEAELKRIEDTTSELQNLLTESKKEAWAFLTLASEIKVLQDFKKSTPIELKCNFSSKEWESGIFHFIGTEGGKKDWANPHTSGLAVVTWSTQEDGQPATVVANTNGLRSYSSNVAGSWVAVSIAASRYQLSPTAYYVKHDPSGSHVLRNWVLEESTDGETWVILSYHLNDLKLSTDGNSTAKWPVEAKPEYFQHFRVRNLGVNGHGSNYLMCQNLELYGKVKRVT